MYFAVVNSSNLNGESNMEELKSALDAINVEVAKVDDVFTSKNASCDDFPNSYRGNSKKEEEILTYCRNFRRQFVHLYRDRKPLLLSPKNECGVEKFICSYVRPTLPPFEELHNWNGCSDFVSDYLNFELLDPPIEIPLVVPSPTTVLKRQRGNSCDYSILLCSLLIGAGYDAYCVSGYASREVTLMDETRETCPLLLLTSEENTEKPTTEKRKYAVKPPKTLKSNFEVKMAAKEQAAIEEKERKLKEDELNRIMELEKPGPDPLLGLRVHFWVLVLSGKRQVPESFFIEPLTGRSKPLDFPDYHGIESVWNHRNFWVNMQDCCKGVKYMSYDLGDSLKWEFMFLNSDNAMLVSEEATEEYLDIEDDPFKDSDSSQFDLAPSWVAKIEITRKQFEMRCPNGKKTILYKKAKIEKFANFLCSDGLVLRLSTYGDSDLKDLKEITEYYKNRTDKLYKRIHTIGSGDIKEFFYPGRPRALKEHHYKASSPGPETERKLFFYSSARNDGLSLRQETDTEMVETFEDRPDRLYYRKAIFGKRVKRFGPQEANNRPILRIIEKFKRNPDVPADTDVAEQMFSISDYRISLTYHLGNDKITASTRDFVKPADYAADKGIPLPFVAENVTSFQVDPRDKAPKDLEMYNDFVRLIERERACTDSIRESEAEVREILEDRVKEEIAHDISVTVYDTERNEKVKLRRQEIERKQREDEMRKRDMQLDYLAPFLAKIGDPEKLNRMEAARISEECLKDLKQRLIDKANLIQARFEKETRSLQEKQDWYQQNQMNMTKEDEEEYLNFCSESMFRIHILELRLNRHKEMAPRKYMEMDDKLRNDPRLFEHFLN